MCDRCDADNSPYRVAVKLLHEAQAEVAALREAAEPFTLRESAVMRLWEIEPHEVSPATLVAAGFKVEQIVRLRAALAPASPADREYRPTDDISEGRQPAAGRADAGEGER